MWIIFFCEYKIVLIVTSGTAGQVYITKWNLNTFNWVTVGQVYITKWNWTIQGLFQKFPASGHHVVNAIGLIGQNISFCTHTVNIINKIERSRDRAS